MLFIRLGLIETPIQRALNQTPWKEYFSGGKKYYYNVRAAKALSCRYTHNFPDNIKRVQVGNAGGAFVVNGKG